MYIMYLIHVRELKKLHCNRAVYIMFICFKSQSRWTQKICTLYHFTALQCTFFFQYISISRLQKWWVFFAKNRKMSKGAVLWNWCSDLDINKIQIYQQIKIFFNPSIVHKSYASIARWNNNILFPMQARGLMGLQLDRWGANVFLLFIFSDFLVIYSHGPKDAKDEVKQARRITALGLGPRLVNLYVHISNISNPNS